MTTADKSMSTPSRNHSWDIQLAHDGQPHRNKESLITIDLLMRGNSLPRGPDAFSNYYYCPKFTSPVKPSLCSPNKKATPEGNQGQHVTCNLQACRGTNEEESGDCAGGPPWGFWGGGGGGGEGGGGRLLYSAGGQESSVGMYTHRWPYRSFRTISQSTCTAAHDH